MSPAAVPAVAAVDPAHLPDDPGLLKAMLAEALAALRASRQEGERLRQRLDQVLQARDLFFEDREVNLEPAFDLGMTTVLVGPHAEASTAHYVRYKAAKLAPFLADARLRDPG